MTVRDRATVIIQKRDLVPSRLSLVRVVVICGSADFEGAHTHTHTHMRKEGRKEGRKLSKPTHTHTHVEEEDISDHQAPHKREDMVVSMDKLRTPP